MPVLSRLKKGNDAFEDIIDQARKANTQGIEPILGIAATETKKISQMYKAETDYIYLIQLLEKEGIRGSISLKPINIGLERSNAECFQNLKFIIREARKTKTFLWLELDSAKNAASILQIYFFALKEYKNIGIVMKTHMKRSEDLNKIISKGATICLADDIYKGHETDYKRMMQILFETSDHFAIASHNKKIIEDAIQMNKAHNKDIEFQFLSGKKNRLKKKLLQNGYKVGDYIVLGK